MKIANHSRHAAASAKAMAPTAKLAKEPAEALAKAGNSFQHLRVHLKYFRAAS